MNHDHSRFDFYLEEMREAMANVLSYSRGMDYHSFSTTPLVRDAVVRNFEIIGECVRHIPFSYQSRHKEIPWNLMLALRNFIVHEFFDVDDEIIWAIIENDLRKNLDDLGRLSAGRH